jgi:hypothetical protein
MLLQITNCNENTKTCFIKRAFRNSHILKAVMERDEKGRVDVYYQPWTGVCLPGETPPDNDAEDCLRGRPQYGSGPEHNCRPGKGRVHIPAEGRQAEPLFYPSRPAAAAPSGRKVCRGQHACRHGMVCTRTKEHGNTWNHCVSNLKRDKEK